MAQLAGVVVGAADGWFYLFSVGAFINIIN